MSDGLTLGRSLKQRWQYARGVVQEYPGQFWILIAATFIDRLGAAMLFPFFTLYLTRKFEIGMTDVGVLFGIFSLASVAGSMTGGALTDRFGRKGVLIFGLVMSALSSVLMGLTERIELFYAIILLVGVMAEAGGPAQQALVADLLPEEKRASGFGILRVAINLAVAIGPLIGGLLATRSYLLLFVSDAATSVITAIIVYFTLKETWGHAADREGAQSVRQSFSGYRDVLRDSAFIWYLFASILMVLVYIQMNTTLAVYLRDSHGVNERGFSYILSLNATMVVLFQFPITRRVTRYRPLIVMASGTLLYAVGFAMYGVVSAYSLFLVAMAIITVGEMVVSPVGQAIVARLAPEDKRGRYMAMYGFAWVIPTAVGPLLAGLVMDNLNPAWVWYAAGTIGVLTAGVFVMLEQRVGRSRWSAVDERLSILEQLEKGQISAHAASLRLEGVSEGEWARLGHAPPDGVRQHLRIRISNMATGAMKVDLRLPLGLVNTALDVGGQLSAELDGYETEDLRELIGRSAAHEGALHLEVSGERVEVSRE